MEKIITAIFKVESEGYQAMTELKNAPVTDDYFVSQAVLVKKEYGTIRALDYFDTGYETTDDAAIGGLVGATIGILGGPLGILLGGTLGALAGHTVDAGDMLDNASILERMTELLFEGEIGLIALAQEAEEGSAQKALSKFDTTVIEEEAAVVAEEVRHAQEVQEELERQARKELRAEKKEDRKQAIAEHRESIKADFADRKEKRAEKKEIKKAEKAEKKEAKKAEKEAKKAEKA